MLRCHNENKSDESSKFDVLLISLFTNKLYGVTKNIFSQRIKKSRMKCFFLTLRKYFIFCSIVNVFKNYAKP